MIKVQPQDFDLNHETGLLAEYGKTGAVVTFVGKVRDEDGRLRALELEHYPGMTERQLQRLEDEALGRWPGIRVTIIHRLGRLAVGENIVLAAVAAPHRADAFAACEFLMDKLKTEAAFWKKEHGVQGEHWVKAKEQDGIRAARWTETSDARPNPGHQS